MGYRIIDTGSPQGIQGGVWPAPPQAQTFTQLFIAVEDVGTTFAQAVAMGAKPLVPPQKLPDGDEMAILQDPQGMSFGLMKAR
jgi:predicted enzyme related to lactoylglutathione lyase